MQGCMCVVGWLGARMHACVKVRGEVGIRWLRKVKV